MVVTKFAIELKKEGIVVLALSPGLVNTAEKPCMYPAKLNQNIAKDQS